MDNFMWSRFMSTHNCPCFCPHKPIHIPNSKPQTLNYEQDWVDQYEHSRFNPCLKVSTCSINDFFWSAIIFFHLLLLTFLIAFDFTLESPFDFFSSRFLYSIHKLKKKKLRILTIIKSFELGNWDYQLTVSHHQVQSWGSKTNKCCVPIRLYFRVSILHCSHCSPIPNKPRESIRNSDS